ncbi:MAG: hypothetical protein WBM24_00585 [Candidatus Sulfotelmatobacter sp.]
MRKVWFAVLLLSGAFLLAQDNKSANTTQQDSKNSKGEVTIQGCVSRSNGDYILMKESPAVSYELQGSRKIKLRHYLGQRVEVTGSESPTLSTSSDAMNKVGSAAPVTLTISSIKTVDKDCSVRDVSR